MYFFFCFSLSNFIQVGFGPLIYNVYLKTWNTVQAKLWWLCVYLYIYEKNLTAKSNVNHAWFTQVLFTYLTFHPAWTTEGVYHFSFHNPACSCHIYPSNTVCTCLCITSAVIWTYGYGFSELDWSRGSTDLALRTFVYEYM